ncbi:hypothetical protein J5Y03_05500 [Bacillus sp. RG28]|uniref:Uncharacterized protein n=1 Tax=Gottfriedia endophytica TaxID=2820819 RepID=A0A940NLB8_9BACI|nr:hypothetical protein [Gottfriedia endophytica]MBP0724641.1 hypothetical protein [Gottfriedia endophytica]
MSKKLDVNKALYHAYKTGLPVKIGLKNGDTLENVIVKKFSDTSFKAKQNEPIEEGMKKLKTIVDFDAVDYVELTVKSS